MEGWCWKSIYFLSKKYLKDEKFSCILIVQIHSYRSGAENLSLETWILNWISNFLHAFILLFLRAVTLTLRVVNLLQETKFHHKEKKKRRAAQSGSQKEVAEMSPNMTFEQLVKNFCDDYEREMKQEVDYFYAAICRSHNEINQVH